MMLECWSVRSAFGFARMLHPLQSNKVGKASATALWNTAWGHAPFGSWLVPYQMVQDIPLWQLWHLGYPLSGTVSVPPWVSTHDFLVGRGETNDLAIQHLFRG